MIYNLTVKSDCIPKEYRAQTLDNSSYKHKMILKNITTQTKILQAIYSNSLNSSNYSTVSPVLPGSIENQPTAILKISEVPTIAEIQSRAVKVFEYPVTERKEISSYLKGRSGVYLWLHKTNGKYYVGSSVNLRNRFYDYFSKSYFDKSGNTIIANAISKYGLGAFEFIILEFTEKDETLSREQFFIDTLRPEYNILVIAGCTLGFKPTAETRTKMSEAALGRKHSLETRAKISESQKNNKNSPGFPLLVKDLETNITTEYTSIAEAAKILGLNHSSISDRLRKGIITPFKNRYEIKIIRPDS